MQMLMPWELFPPFEEQSPCRHPRILNMLGTRDPGIWPSQLPLSFSGMGVWASQIIWAQLLRSCLVKFIYWHLLDGPTNHTRGSFTQSHTIWGKHPNHQRCRPVLHVGPSEWIRTSPNVQCPGWRSRKTTLQRSKTSYLGKRKIIFKSAFLVDMFVPRRLTTFFGLS